MSFQDQPLNARQLQELSRIQGLILNARQLQERASEYQEQAASEMAEELRHLLIFFLEGQWFAFSLDELREVIPVTPISRLPALHSSAAGLINLRGHLMLTFDLRPFFGMTTDTSLDKIIVIENNEQLTGLLVETIQGVESFAKQRFQSNVETASGIDAQFIRGSLLYQEHPLIWLNVHTIVQALERLI